MAAAVVMRRLLVEALCCHRLHLWWWLLVIGRWILGEARYRLIRSKHHVRIAIVKARCWLLWIEVGLRLVRVVVGLRRHHVVMRMSIVHLWHHLRVVVHWVDCGIAGRGRQLGVMLHHPAAAPAPVQLRRRLMAERHRLLLLATLLIVAVQRRRLARAILRMRRGRLLMVLMVHASADSVRRHLLCVGETVGSRIGAVCDWLMLRRIAATWRVHGHVRAAAVRHAVVRRRVVAARMASGEVVLALRTHAVGGHGGVPAGVTRATLLVVAALAR